LNQLYNRSLKFLVGAVVAFMIFAPPGTMVVAIAASFIFSPILTVIGLTLTIFAVALTWRTQASINIRVQVTDQLLNTLAKTKSILRSLGRRPKS